MRIYSSRGQRCRVFTPSRARVSLPITLPCVLSEFLSALVLSAVLVTSPAMASEAALGVGVVQDGANILRPDKQVELAQSLRTFEAETGFKIRVLTEEDAFEKLNREAQTIKSTLGLDRSSVLVVLDPTAPNVLDFKVGSQLRGRVGPQFFSELTGRYGNLFYVRDEGEAAAITASVAALVECLPRDEANICLNVPGVDESSFWISLVFGIAAGVILGGSARIDYAPKFPKGSFAVAFAPLWFPFIYYYSLAPLTSRGASPLYVGTTLLLFLATAWAVWSQDKIGSAVGLSMDEGDDDY